MLCLTNSTWIYLCADSFCPRESSWERRLKALRMWQSRGKVSSQMVILVAHNGASKSHMKVNSI